MFIYQFSFFLLFWWIKILTASKVTVFFSIFFICSGWRIPSLDLVSIVRMCLPCERRINLSEKLRFWNKFSKKIQYLVGKIDSSCAEFIKIFKKMYCILFNPVECSCYHPLFCYFVKDKHLKRKSKSKLEPPGNSEGFFGGHASIQGMVTVLVARQESRRFLMMVSLLIRKF